MVKSFIVGVFALALLISFPKDVRSQPVAEYPVLIAFISLAAVVGFGNISNPGNAVAYANIMDLAQANAEAASDGFESGDTTSEVSNNFAAEGNLRAAQQLLAPDDEESQVLISDAREALGILRAAALERLTDGGTTCGNGALDPGEECDNSSGQKSCPEGSFCLEDCVCSELR